MVLSTTTSSEVFPIGDIQIFKSQVLAWLENFKVACYLDSNSYQLDPYHSYECLVAVGLKTELYCMSEAGAFNQLKKFYDKTNDWLFGFLAYDLKNNTEHLTSNNYDGVKFPALHFFQPLYVLEINEKQVVIHSRYKKPFHVFQKILNADSFLKKNCDTPLLLSIQSRFSKKEYLQTVRAIKNHILQGDIYEMNFCQEFFIENCQLNPYQTFSQLNRIAKATFSAFYKLNDKYLLCASPERFLKKSGGRIISQPIKGTIRRGRSAAEDKLLQQELFQSKKDRSENVMIVDLVRNDLSRSCKAGSVKVGELFSTYAFEQVHHLISTVTGELQNDSHPVDAIRHAFPMGSMTGAPKVSSMQLIELFEKTKRGLYSGAVGYFTPNGDFDFNVVIRSMLYSETENYLSMEVGGAIVHGSEPSDEYQECLLKAKGMFSVLNTGLNNCKQTH